MENPTAFDLNQAAGLWREQLAHSAAVGHENLDELESHLRDSVSGLMARGLSEEESFLIATRRLGKGEALAEEFGKVNPAAVWRDRALWMLAGMLFQVIGWNFSLATYTAVIYFGNLTGMSGFLLGWIGVTAGFAALGFFAALFWLLMTNRMSRCNEVVIWLRIRPVVCGAILLGTVLAMKLLAGIFATLFIQDTGAKILARAYSISTLFSAFGPVFAVAAMIILFARLLSDRQKNTGAIRISSLILVPFFITSVLPPQTSAQVIPDSRLSSAKAANKKKDSAALDDVTRLWRAGKKDEAIVKFLAVDFSKRPLFPTGSVLNFTEVQFMALPEAARTKLSTQMNDDLKVLKEIAAHVKSTATSAMNSGDKAKSDNCLAQLKACGQAFDQPDSLALLKLVGKAFVKLGAPLAK